MKFNPFAKKQPVDSSQIPVLGSVVPQAEQSVASVSPAKKGFFRRKLKLIVALSVLLLLALAAYFAVNKIVYKDSITVSNQVFSESVYIDRVVLSKGGRVGVMVLDSVGQPRAMAGLTPHLEPDTYTGMNIRLSVTGEQITLPKKGDTVYVGIWDSSNATSFDARNEQIRSDFFGKPIVQRIVLE